MDIALFDNIALFSQLGPSERRELSALFATRDFEPQQPIFWIGDPGNEFFVVQRGSVIISCPDQSGKEISLALLDAGDFFGEIALLDTGPRSASARAAVPTTLLALSRDDFHRFVRQYPSAALHIMTVLGRRQRESLDKLRGIRNLNEVMREQQTPFHHVAHVITRAAGHHLFVISHTVAFVTWIIINVCLGRGRAFDPFPFPFLALWASVEAMFLSLFIVISQNMQAQKDRLRTELEYQVALKMQVELMQLHQKMDRVLAATGAIEAKPALTVSTVGELGAGLGNVAVARASSSSIMAFESRS